LLPFSHRHARKRTLRGVHARTAGEDFHHGLLGLNPPEDEKPPPIREVLRVPVDDEGREIQAS
jgi:hypothetical protein